MNIETEVQNFYSKIKFPGPYTMENLTYYDKYDNNFLKPYITAGNRAMNILEIGCGTGFITNLIAYKNKFCTIDAIDFSDSIDYAKTFSKENKLTNITYHKINFLDFNPVKKYDLVISNGVLHHIPRYLEVIETINQLAPEEMILGVYNYYGKLAKKLFNVTYVNKLLEKDQEHAPYEVTFKHKQFCNFFPNYELHNVHPGYKFVDLRNLFNYKNGGLTVYHFTRNFG